MPQRERSRRRVVYTNKHKIGERVKEIQNPQTNINKNIKQNKPEYLRNGRENSNKQASSDESATDPSRRRRSVSLDSYGRTVLPTVNGKKGIREHGVAN